VLSVNRIARLLLGCAGWLPGRCSGVDLELGVVAGLLLGCSGLLLGPCWSFSIGLRVVARFCLDVLVIASAWLRCCYRVKGGFCVVARVFWVYKALVDVLLLSYGWVQCFCGC